MYTRYKLRLEGRRTLPPSRDECTSLSDRLVGTLPLKRQNDVGEPHSALLAPSSCQSNYLTMRLGEVWGVLCQRTAMHHVENLNNKVPACPQVLTLDVVLLLHSRDRHTSWFANQHFSDSSYPHQLPSQ
ncbi:hypothetical protein NDU88_008719 [Pleurodeles waltl]|uniref:Uncharacterized protein n=1 Tax=Pleurodeles waltl TaxID=8319 RepID=A0AAV7QPK2_PLEWA|nr:hypothetical protein NDU88_008719 [Pleurodeles waltl]